MNPTSGMMYWWRGKGTLSWRFGYCTHLSRGMVRMGSYNGDTSGGHVVLAEEIEWRPYDG